jgi:hypothetical protein
MWEVFRITKWRWEYMYNIGGNICTIEATINQLQNYEKHIVVPERPYRPSDSLLLSSWTASRTFLLVHLTMFLNCESLSFSDNPRCEHLHRLLLWSSLCFRTFFHSLDCTSFRTYKTRPVWLYDGFEESELVHINIASFLPLGTVTQNLCIRNNAQAYLPRIRFLFVEN